MKHTNSGGVFSFVLGEGEDSLSSFYIRKNTQMQKAIFPQGLKRVEEMAFYNCKALKEVVFPDTLEYLGNDIFAFSSDDIRIEYEGSSKQWRKLVEGVTDTRYELERGEWDKYPYYNSQGSSYVETTYEVHFDGYCDKIEVFCKKDGKTLYYGWEK